MLRSQRTNGLPSLSKRGKTGRTLMPKIFDKETIDLLRSLIKAQDKKIPIVEEKNIGELPSLARHIIVDASINKSEIADIISCYKYVFKVQNILVCVEYDGYTLYEVKL